MKTKTLTFTILLAALGLAVNEPPAAALELTRGPYLQMGAPTSVLLRWRTDVASDSAVCYGTDASTLNQTASVAAVLTEHKVRLTGLTPNTKYFYSIGATATTLAEGTNYFFVTAPSSPKPTRVWVAGDCGAATRNPANTLAVRDAYSAFAGTNDTDLWLMLGDNAYDNGRDGEYQTNVFNVFTNLLPNSVLWPTLGNHELYSTYDTADFPFLHIFSTPMNGEASGVSSGRRKYYSFDYANIHFVCLDAMSSDRTSGGEMLEWLEQDVTANTQDWLIAFWHHPPYTKGSHDSDNEGELIEMRENALPILEAHGVDLVVNGHSHNYERSLLMDGHYGTSGTFTTNMIKDAGVGVSNDVVFIKPVTGPVPHAGTVYVVAGTSGQTAPSPIDHPALPLAMNQLGSLVLDIDGNTLEATFLRDTGAVADHFKIIKSGTGASPPASPPIGPLSIEMHPENQSVSLGAKVTLTTEALSPELPAYQWYWNGTNIASATNGSLVLSNVQLAQAGGYTVVAGDSSGSVTSRVALLDVDTTFTQITTGVLATDVVLPSGTWVDYDGDGFLDLFVANFNFEDPNDRLYHNNRDGTFTRILLPNDTGASDLGSWGDYDGDGLPDLFVGNQAPMGKPGTNILWHNTGTGTFTRVFNTIVASNVNRCYAAAWADFDRNGTLDLFTSSLGGGQNYLYRNVGGGGFIRETNGTIASDAGPFAGAAWADYDGDGWPDLFIARDNTNGVSLLYRNNRDGTFTSVTNAGLSTVGAYSVGVAWGDYNNDGLLDLFVANGENVRSERSFLYHNNGDGTLTLVTNSVVGRDYGNSVGCAWGDYDNDGFLDLIVANELGKAFLYHNNGDGTFSKVTTGSIVNNRGRGAYTCVWGDYNNDGFLDLHVGVGINPASDNNLLFRNNGNSNAWFKAKLISQYSNRLGVGAKVRVRANIGGVMRWQLRQIGGGGLWTDAGDGLANFGLGDATNIDTVRIEWPSGTVQELHDIVPRQFLSIMEAPAGPAVFYVPPQSQLVPTRSNFTVQVTTASQTPVGYQWQKDGVAIPGATNSTLTISNVQLADGGSYVLVANNASGPAFSPPAVITVAPLFIIAQPQSVNVRAGSNTTFSVSVLSGSTPVYQWRRNGTDIANATNAAFSITNVQANHEGSYTAFIANTDGSATSAPATLLLYANPAVLQPPLSQTVIAGGNVTVSVTITGNPPPFLYQWRRGIPVTGTLTNIVLNERTCFFTLLNVQTNQGGQYRVLVTNAALPSLSVGAFFTLTVLPDADTNGLPDDWIGVNDDPLGDADGDGLNNLDEYRAGTNPTNALSYLKIEQSSAPGSNTLSFLALSNKTYTVEFTEALGSDVWTKAADFVARSTNHTERVVVANTDERRFYRVLTPRKP